MTEQAVTQGTMRTAAGVPLPLQHTDIRAEIAGPLAEVTVKQRFKNDGDAPIEAVYLFPLPHDASVHRMEFHIEDRVVRGVVKEKAEARRAYEQARSEGRAATLLEEDRPSIFSLSVANIAPGATIDVELAYQEVVPFDDGHFRFVFPMVAPPRYAGSTSGDSGPRLPTGERAADLALSVAVRASAAIETVRCASHKTESRTDPDGTLHVRLPATGPIANRDFVLTWQASDTGVRPRVHFERAAGKTGTFLLLLTPSAPREDGKGTGQDQLRALKCGNCGGVITDMTAIRDIPGVGPVVPCKYCGAILAPGTETVTRAVAPRDVIVLVDRSASMRSSYEQASRAAIALLSNLPLGDGVQLFAFDHDQAAFDGDGTGFVSLAPEVVSQAATFLKGLSPRGGSELLKALTLASKLPRRPGRTCQFVLITDAAAGNEGLLLRKIPELLGPDARLYVLGVGPSVDRRLVARLAQVGGGAHDVILPDEDVEITLDRFARRVREGGPVLRDLAVSWDGAGMASSHPAKVPDLFGGQPVQVLGRYDGVGPTRLVLTGRTALDKPYRQEIDVDLPTESAEVPGLFRLWARRHVDALAEQHRAQPARDELRREALSLSLECSIVGPFTSLVAEDSVVAVQKVRVKKLVLYVEHGNDVGKSFVLDEPRLRVGHFEECDIHLRDTSVSRAHCELIVEGQTFTLIDAASTNGTFINGRSVRRATLAVGQVLTMGSTRLRVLEYQGDDPYFEVLPTKQVHMEAREKGHQEQEHENPPARSLAAPPPPGSPPAPMRVGGPPVLAGSPPSPPGFGPPPAPGGFGPPPAAPGGFGPPPAAPGGFGPPPAAPPPPPPAFMPPPMLSPSPVYSPSPVGDELSFGGGSAPELEDSLAPPPKSPAPAMARSAAYAPPPPARPAAYGQGSSAQPPQLALETPGSDPYPEQELRLIDTRVRGELDLVFLVDATGSMGEYIRETQRQLLSLIGALRRSPLCKSLRVGVVSYRDHPPQDTSYVVDWLDLTDDLDEVQRKVESLAAQGGGDGPESVTDGLARVVRLDYRPSAARAVVWFGDAPPHGVEPDGDAFPGGCPCGDHWFSQAESCREMGIAVYAIGCLPTLRRYAGAEAVFRQVARTSRGMFMALREAALLVPILLGAAQSELDRQRIDEHVADLYAAHEAALTRTDEAERVRFLTATLRDKGVRPRGVVSTSDHTTPPPLLFRDLTADDVEGSLWRLRSQGRIAA
ncbi:MAG: VIT domain-containing protein [Polyangiaceae bacterium]